MNSDDLITKYRPKTWDEFIGNDATVKSLMDSVDVNNAHSYLLTGPSGCGKTTAARIISTELHCDNPFELDAATNNSVDDIRAITEELKFKSVLGTPKVFIIDECHMLSRNAWNAFLKAVEEPPSHVYWIFCTTEPSKVIDTVRTRCFKAEFKPLHTDYLCELLLKIAEAEGFETNNAVIDVCAESAAGGPRAALSNLAVCWSCKDVSAAYELLRRPGVDSEAVDLARALVEGKPWPHIHKIIVGLDKAGITAESVRRVVQDYVCKVALSDPEKAKKVMPLLDLFSQPFRDEGMAPLLVNCAGHLFSEPF